MDYKSKYLKYKKKYLELKKQTSGVDNSTNDIYIELWKIKDSKDFDDNKDGKVSKYEYMQVVVSVCFLVQFGNGEKKMMCTRKNYGCS